MRHRYYAAVALLSLLLSTTFVHAQNSKEKYQEWKKRVQEEYNDHKHQQKEEYERFRQKANAEYAEFVRKHWEEIQALKGIKPPEPDPIPPVVIPEGDKDKERKDNPKPFKDVVLVQPPKPQPRPVEPVVPVVPVSPKPLSISTIFFGTQMECTISMKPEFVLNSLMDAAIGDAWEQLSDGECDELLSQCLGLRSQYRLSDWGYIQLLDSISKKTVSKMDHSHSLDEATLLMAWLYCQSGYKMRLARAGGHLYMLYASENIIYNVNYFEIGGERFYPYKEKDLETIFVCDATFPQEQAMTLRIVSEPQLTNNPSSTRTLQSKQYSSIKVKTSVNRNLIDFYNCYPTGSITEDYGTRWEIYANTPMSDNTKQTLYPQLRNLLAGKNKLQATEELLNFVQTSLVYENDDKVWGGDRAFFAEETLFYPYADCEDRSIFFSRLVRDLLELDVVLLYYPGHLATAVRFEGECPKGDYIKLSDGRYYIADPTYIGAPVGHSMPDLKDTKIKVIVLN